MLLQHTVQSSWQCILALAGATIDKPSQTATDMLHSSADQEGWQQTTCAFAPCLATKRSCLFGLACCQTLHCLYLCFISPDTDQHPCKWTASERYIAGLEDTAGRSELTTMRAQKSLPGACSTAVGIAASIFSEWKVKDPLGFATATPADRDRHSCTSCAIRSTAGLFTSPLASTCGVGGLSFKQSPRCALLCMLCCIQCKHNTRWAWNTAIGMMWDPGHAAHAVLIRFANAHALACIPRMQRCI